MYRPPCWNWSLTTFCLRLARHLRVTLRCAVNITASSFQHVPWSLTGRDITAGQQTMSRLIVFGELTGQPFRFASRFDLSHWIILKMKFIKISMLFSYFNSLPCKHFRRARLSSLPTNACSTENNIPFPNLASHIVLSKFWEVDLDLGVIR